MAWALAIYEEDVVVIPSAGAVAEPGDSGGCPRGQRPGRMKTTAERQRVRTDAGQGTLLAGRYRLAERLREQDGSAEWRAADEMLAARWWSAS